MEIENKSIINKDYYNKIPVYYCTVCLSLKIRSIENTDLDYCDECGSVQIGTTDIVDWQQMYKEKYKKDF